MKMDNKTPDPPPTYDEAVKYEKGLQGVLYPPQSAEYNPLQPHYPNPIHVFPAEQNQQGEGYDQYPQSQGQRAPGQYQQNHGLYPPGQGPYPQCLGPYPSGQGSYPPGQGQYPQRPTQYPGQGNPPGQGYLNPGSYPPGQWFNGQPLYRPPVITNQADLFRERARKKRKCCLLILIPVFAVIVFIIAMNLYS